MTNWQEYLFVKYLAKKSIEMLCTGGSGSLHVIDGRAYHHESFQPIGSVINTYTDGGGCSWWYAWLSVATGPPIHSCSVVIS